MVAQFHRKETVQLFALSMDHTTVPLITSKKFDPNIWQFTAKKFAKEGLKYKINLQQIVRDLRYCKGRSSVWWAPILSMYDIILILFSTSGVAIERFEPRSDPTMLQELHQRHRLRQTRRV